MTQELINGRPIEAYAYCACSCGNRVNSPKSTFRPGHDQKVVQRLAFEMSQAVASGDDIWTFAVENAAKKFSPALQGKIHNAFASAKKRGRAAAKKAKETAVRREEFDAILKTPTTIKVGRWEYPAKTNNLGILLRNTKRDGSGEWIRHTENGRIMAA